ncbi:class II fructose-1,6-bisphosphate aldolase [Parageobacillus thermoglucosidasius]|uniref:class II fructose-1,6-bisphosphate aldolase n=1 Tax=Parageobacillus thermoglucosidasius TaxID=1426 RepID=UPI002E23D8E0|nr:class II fructose-1,6-bisphosphate aldolase [Parageobacillus thermoglucosidasius]MED4904819.1 class II fructose-1,6-bisphosphate aldolase [Parageobacillus thermoglucosidasius]MED4913618.1 class II fructose-1,6-bisphosphate aldolase [Parageobacillus thermoglucosidasius]MED4944986.1 class II fructose-1,6-bisphosphate aldolase [Parageobacillus thermoglucosidasius]MED4983405.1 class II fructose-1,6-bisphosphate aldolase [Parageobacillus thermoglucosidasius]
MALVSMREMLRQALEEKYAVGHFNINNLEFAQAILQAAEEEQSPVILAVSPGYIPHLGGLRTAAAIVKELIKEYNITVPVALHLDHGSSYEQCLQAMYAGFTSVMIDASHYPLEMNIAETKKVVEAARVFNVSVEAEVGRIGGQEDNVIVDEAEAMYAIPEECERLVKETGVDCLAPALGSVHGPYKGEPKLGFSEMERIMRLTGVPLVLHGGTGIPLDDIRRAISLGTAKINVNTENQIAFTNMIRHVLKENIALYDPRKYLAEAREAIKNTVKQKMRQFGSSGKAERIRGKSRTKKIIL